MDDFSAFTNGERAVLDALSRRGVRFMLVGLSTGVLHGANTGTRDIDVWFEDTSDRRTSSPICTVLARLPTNTPTPSMSRSTACGSKYSSSSVSSRASALLGAIVNP
jgi:hypothetical protein